MANNELALQFYNAGFFAPQMADAALACLDMMDFDKRDAVIQKVQQNGTLLQMLQQTQQLALQLANQISPDLAANMAAQFGMAAAPGGPVAMASGGDAQAPAPDLEALGGDGGKESSVTKNARMRAAQGVEVR